ncbi:ThiF family adenylyltransferase [Alicyclobacillus curvatus]|nr:ThiF family adenylyltransferase [Alicyclobacillus curvatus]
MVGVFGIGSPVTEMLYRLGVGHLVLVDGDKIEIKNVGRIYNSTMNNARSGEFKVHMMERAIKPIGYPYEGRFNSKGSLSS